MIFSINRLVLVLLFLFKYSYTLECSNQTVNFDTNTTEFKIKSDPNDLMSKTCKYTFTVPKYFVPSLSFLGIQLTGDNKIVTRQYSEYGGSQDVEIQANFTQMTLYPINFTIEIRLPKKTADDTFYIFIRVKDKSPDMNGDRFVVTKDLGILIDSFRLRENSSIVQQFDTQNPQATSYTIRVAFFSDLLLASSLSNVFVYDDGIFKGSLLDVFNSQNSSVNKICYGSQFAIVNAGSYSIFTVLISEAHEWDESSVSVSNTPVTNTTQTFTATSGLVVFHEISGPIGTTNVPSLYQQITFRGDGELKVFAGCVTGEQESKRIATITPSNAHNYENLLIYGICKTFVLTKGVLQWQSTKISPITYKHEIGQKGVIMNNDYPYPQSGTGTTSNVTSGVYLIQSPNIHENIIVNYEIASMASNVNFQIDQYISGFKDANKTLTSSDTSYTSISTYQQYNSFSVPISSNGFLIRYTVTSSASFASSIGAIFVLFYMIFC